MRTQWRESLRCAKPEHQHKLHGTDIQACKHNGGIGTCIGAGLACLLGDGNARTFNPRDDDENCTAKHAIVLQPHGATYQTIEREYTTNGISMVDIRPRATLYNNQTHDSTKCPDTICEQDCAGRASRYLSWGAACGCKGQFCGCAVRARQRLE